MTPEADVDDRAAAVPKVSVVIPVFNAARVLGATLASVVGQDHAPDEVVVVDDGSIDATSEVARRFDAMLPMRVERLSANRGVAVALHHAIELARNDLIVPVGGDDILLPEHTGVLLGIYQRHGGMVAPRLVKWTSGLGLEISAHHDDRVLPTDRDGWVLALLRENFLHGAPLISKGDYEVVGGYRADMSGAEDWDLWLRVARAGIPIHVAPHPTYLYRQQPGTLSMTPTTLAASVRVLERAVDDAESPSEARAARQSLARWRARRSLADAYDAARRGDAWAARRAAARAVLGGSRRVRVLGAGLALAPNTSSHVRDAISQGRA